jgi:hypothetical protein
MHAARSRSHVLPSLRGALATKQSILAFFFIATWIASLALAIVDSAQEPVIGLGEGDTR